MKDACVLFDLMDLGLLDRFFALGLQVVTSPQVVREVARNDQREILAAVIAERKLVVDSRVTLEDILAVKKMYPGLTFTDCSVFALARQMDGIILSSDKGVRNAAKKNLIEVHGTLWIVELLVQRGEITKTHGIDSLKLLMDVNNRAPVKAIRKLIRDLTDLPDE